MKFIATHIINGVADFALKVALVAFQAFKFELETVRPSQAAIDNAAFFDLRRFFVPPTRRPSGCRVVFAHLCATVGLNTQIQQQMDRRVNTV